MSVFIGDDSNQAKLASLSKGVIVGRWGEQEKGKKVVSVGFFGKHDPQDSAAKIFHCNDVGDLFVRKKEEDEIGIQLSLLSDEELKSREKLVDCLFVNSAENGVRRMVTSTLMGNIAVHNLEEADDGQITMASCDTHSVSTTAITIHMSRNDDSKLVLGGMDRRVAEYDIDSWQKTFEAKNLPDDKLLRLAQRIDQITAVRYCPGGSSMLGASHFNGMISIYDTRKQRKPLHYIDSHLKEEDKCPLNTLEFIDERRILTGDRRGIVREFDLRKSRIAASYTAMGGSIRSISVDSQNETFLCGGLDRNLFFFDLKSRKLLNKIYTRTVVNKIGTILVTPESHEEIVTPRAKVNKEADEVFDSLEKVIEEGDRGKRKRKGGAGTNTTNSKKTRN